VEQLGFKAVSMTGAGLSNSRLSQPDIGIMSLTENVAACQWIAHFISIPMMADADTGYGNPVTVRHTVQFFEEAGVVGINIEAEFLLPEEMERKYHSGERSSVVRP
jgi:2-methylisocitrate lyase-like PEP mutase family enzyme